ncbi:MAG: FGGY family carbohydrate kinase, partial [Gemmatimonadota bacterium]|nr:FGGY family carbohydrate kinase [Gemmatimonadota bacterium]
MDCLIGIDIGSTGAKSAMFSADGALLDIEFRPYPIDYPEANRAEQDPNLWWNALAGTVRAIVERKPRGNDIVAMCLSTQGGCLLLVDQDFRPLCNAVHWLDKRAGEVSGLLAEKVGAEELYRTCGWSVMDGLNFPAAFWFREKRPELFEKARYFCSTVDYLNYRLTGVFSIDYTNLAMTQFLDLDARDWSDKNLHLAGITRAHVPEIIPSGAVISKLSPRAAEELG